ncbi:MAG: asparagine--tRNA ligase [Proteobacteria bacterium]|jgi:asparaginyl-tRNA synthetase|nr:asparagine--tRNA ligase [Pseudomonadota bacterium]
MKIFTVKELLHTEIEIDSIIVLKGWVRNRRDSKAGLSFIMVNDGSCFDSIQVVAENTLANYESEILKITKDCSVIVTGKVVKSLGKGQSIEIVATIVEVVGFVENPDTYPVSLKRHTVEYLREVAHLRIRTNLFSAISRVRNTICFSIHEYLNKNGFSWIHTPIITSSDAEGAGEMFRVTALDLDKLPRNLEGKIDFKQDFFARETFLTVSGQLNVESYCMALSKVYTFGPTFRAENSNTTRHLAEFWMVEPEIAFANLMDNAGLAESLIKYVFKAVLDKNPDDMRFFAEFIDKGVVTRLESLVNSDFAMMSYTDAVNQLLKSNKKFENPVHWGIDLSSEHERWLCEEYVGRPTIVTDYPKDIKAFYMRLNDDGKTVAAMDILAPGIGEIVGGAAREERYDMLLKRMNEMGMSDKQLDWYLDLRRFGSVPHAGFGVGLERLVSYITGVQNIRDVIPFPRTSKSANF